jgi:hypothetical protein
MFVLHVEPVGGAEGGAKEGPPQLALPQGQQQSRLVGVEPQLQASEVGLAEMVGGVTLQEGPFAAEIGQAEGSRTDWGLVEGGVVELARAQARQKVAGQDAD